MDDKSSGLYTLGLPAEEEKIQKQQIEKKEYFWGALCRSMTPSFNVRNINVLRINREWLKFRAHLLYHKLCRSTALYINKKNFERSDIGVSPSGAK
jgi:hypothetical protein